MRKIVHCELCGTKKDIKMYEYKNSKYKRFFCSKGHFYEWQRVNHPYGGEKSHNWAGGKIEVSCFVCGKTKKIYPSIAKEYKIHYCSSNCISKDRKGMYIGEKSPLWKGGLQETECAYCSKAIKILRYRIQNYKNNFCSAPSDCQSKWRSLNSAGENNPNYRGGLSYEPYTNGWTERLRESIRDRDSRQCTLCELKEEENGVKLSVHHIDYNKENNNVDNLISLCHICHSKTNYNRDYWQDLFTQKNGDLVINNHQQLSIFNY